MFCVLCLSVCLCLSVSVCGEMCGWVVEKMADRAMFLEENSTLRAPHEIPGLVGAAGKKKSGAMRGPNKCRDAACCVWGFSGRCEVETHHSRVKRNGALQAALAR